MRHLSKFFYLTTTALVLIFCLDLQAQKSKTQLQKEKSSIQNQIKEAQEILAQTSSKKKASIGQLNAINKFRSLLKNLLLIKLMLIMMGERKN